MSVSQHDLTGLNLPHRVLRIKCRQSIIQQILGQTLCPCPRAAQQKNPAPFLFITPQILQQCLKTVVIGSDRFRSDVKSCVRLQQTALPVNCGQHCHMAACAFCGSLVHAVHKFHLTRQNIPFFRAMFHTLPEFQFHRICVLPYS